MMAVADTPRQGSGHRQMHFRRLFHFLLAVVVLIVQLSLCFNSLAISITGGLASMLLPPCIQTKTMEQFHPTRMYSSSEEDEIEKKTAYRNYMCNILVATRIHYIILLVTDGICI